MTNAGVKYISYMTRMALSCSTRTFQAHRRREVVAMSLASCHVSELVDALFARILTDVASFDTLIQYASRHPLSHTATCGEIHNLDRPQSLSKDKL